LDFRGAPLNAKTITMAQAQDQIRILIVDDHKLMRQGLRMLIENRPDMAVVGEAGNRKEALAVTAEGQPDIILLDLDLGDENCLELLRDLGKSHKGSRVIILTGVRDSSLHKRALLMGAMGLVMKDHAAEVLLKAIERVHAGEAWIEHSMTASLLRQPALARRQQGNVELTGRELEIVTLACEGLKNTQIAARLFISEATVRNHLTSVLRKLQLTDRFELALYCYRHGMARPPQPGS
jgi:DNA-binding NarL/FixJ family response regulator